MVAESFSIPTEYGCVGEELGREVCKDIISVCMRCQSGQIAGGAGWAQGSSGKAGVVQKPLFLDYHHVCLFDILFCLRNPSF